MWAQLDLCWSSHVIDEVPLVSERLREPAFNEVDAHVVVLASVVQPDNGQLSAVHAKSVVTDGAEAQYHLAWPCLEVIPEGS